jgi:glycine/D-amino acid oxidase-like deaminating enzyme/nitrite reductase/ring-hydroxylating ferredoxin subunit
MNASGERTKSLWMATEVLPSAPHLQGNRQCDTVIVGAGMAGLSTAYELAAEGQRVIVVDRGPVAGGMTARTTAHLAPICDDSVGALIKLRGEDTARLFHASQEAAVTRIDQIVGQLGISCHFRRLDAFLFPAMDMGRADARDEREKEYEAAQKAGVAAERVQGVPLKGFENAPALRYPNQATFHPLQYLQGLAAAIRQKGGEIFAESPVTKIDETARNVLVHTAHGIVSAPHAVFATNSPINTRFKLHSKMAPYRTYAMAFMLPAGALPDALYWDMADPYHYVRLASGPGNSNYLIVGGEDHKSGEADDGDARFRALEGWMRALVPELGNEAARWSGQVLETIDYCGFIGRNPGSENVFVATGDSGQGMTHGALAGILLKDLIVNGTSPWQAVYEPSRKTPAGLFNYVSENATAIKNFAEYVMPGNLASVDALRPGQGGIIRDGMSKVAACRDLEGRLHVHSAACTHLGCVVHWNSTEQCWDCPCHGSQFAPDGAVLNGPAISALPSAQLPSATRQRAKADVS